MIATEFDRQYKLLLLGDSGTGKSSILLRFVNDQFNPNFLSTIGIDFRMKTISVPHQGGGSHKVRLTLWDTAGQERFRTITRQYMRGSHGIALVYDSTDRATFENISNWLAQVEFMDLGPQTVIALVANKSDMPGQLVDEDEGRDLALEKGIQFFKTSAKDGTNIDTVFAAMTIEIERRLFRKGELMQRNHIRVSESSTTDASSHVVTFNLRKGEQPPVSCCGGGIAGWTKS